MLATNFVFTVLAPRFQRTIHNIADWMITQIKQVTV